MEYEGALSEDGKRQGFGILIRPCGSRFEGYFVNDLANGPGKFTHPSGIQAHTNRYLCMPMQSLYSGLYKSYITECLCVSVSESIHVELYA